MVTLVLFSACDQKEVLTGDFSLVSPLPRIIVPDETIDTPMVISCRTFIGYPEGNDALRDAAEMLAQQLGSILGKPLRTVPSGKRPTGIRLRIDPELGAGLADF